MIDPRFVFLGAALTMVGSLTYAYGVLRGRVTPNRVTWFFWALAPIIAFAAELDRGVGVRSVMTLSVGLGPAIVFVTSVVTRNSTWTITRFDAACGVLSAVAIIGWQLSGDATLAVVLSVVADLAAGIPTVRKAWTAPETEHAGAFRNSALNAGITLLTIDHWTLVNWAFPAYIAAIATLTWALVSFRIGSRRTPRLRAAGAGGPGGQAPRT